MDEMLDAENKLLAENLASKVSRLKSVCEELVNYISYTNTNILIILLY